MTNYFWLCQVSHSNKLQKRKVYCNKIYLKKLKGMKWEGGDLRKRFSLSGGTWFLMSFYFLILSLCFSFLFSLFIYDREWFHHFFSDTFSVLTANSWLIGIPYFPFWSMKGKIWAGQVFTLGPSSYSQRTARDYQMNSQL